MASPFSRRPGGHDESGDCADRQRRRSCGWAAGAVQTPGSLSGLEFLIPTMGFPRKSFHLSMLCFLLHPSGAQTPTSWVV